MIFCYSVGALSDLLARFCFLYYSVDTLFWYCFCLEFYLIGSLYESVLFSVVFIACANLFIYLFIYLFATNLLYCF